jgi:hypothetical protein
MKIFTFLLFSSLLLSLYLCNEETSSEQDSNDNKSNSDETQLEAKTKEDEFNLRKIRRENNRKFKQKIKDYIKDFDLENQKIITREQFKTVFLRLYDFGGKELQTEFENEGKKEEKKINSKIDKIYAEKIIDNLVDKNIKEIDVDEIFGFFEPRNIIFAMKDTMTLLGMEKEVDSLSDSIKKEIKAIDERNKNKEKENENEENSDL